MDSLPPGIDLSTIPIASNPNGDPPNFVDPPSLAPAVLGVGIALIIISGIFVMLRLITNLKNTSKLALDDYLCLFAEVGGIGYWAIVNSLGQDGIARHTWDVPVTVITKSFIQRQFSLQMIIGPTLWASKAAILALYIRIFSPVRWLRLTSYGLILFTFLFYWSNVAVASIFCLPRNGAPWDATAFKRCSSPVASVIVNGVFGVAADLAIFILPFPVVYGLQLGRRKKIGLRIVFSVGLLTVITSVASLAYRVYVFQGEDPMWNGINLAITTFAEIFGAIIVSCAPALYSCWSNITKTELYSSLRSRFLSHVSRSTDKKAGGIEYYRKGVHHHSSSSNLKHNHAYDKLDDDSSLIRLGGPQMETFCSTETSIPTKAVITKTTDIHQSSVRV